MNQNKSKNNMKKDNFQITLCRGMADTGMTDEILSSKIGYAADSVYRWRTGKARPSNRAKKACMQAITKNR